MNRRVFFPLIVSILAAGTAADPSTGQTVDSALQKSPPSADGPRGNSVEENARFSADEQRRVQPYVAGAEDDDAAAAESSTSAYDYSSAFERIAKDKTTRSDTRAPIFTEDEQKLWTPEPPGTEDQREDEIAEDEEIELEIDVELSPLNTYLQKEHFEALGKFVGSMRDSFDQDVYSVFSDESKLIAAKVKAPRHTIAKAFDSVLDDNHIGYFQPVHAKRLQSLHLLGLADEELHNRRAHLADSQGLPYVPKRWAVPSDSPEVLKIKRGPLINHGFASATYAVRRIFPYKNPSRTLAEKEGSLKVFIVKRKTISDDLAEEILQHQCSMWKALPPERSEELAENSHLLYPVSVLKLVEDKKVARTPKKQKPAGAADHEEHVHKEVLSDLLNGKILNLFLLYPRAYECTLKYFIVSRGRTDLLTKIAPMKVMMSISVQMIYAVAQLNSYGVVHTKIRPTSFVITGDGKVLLTDFFSLTESGTSLDCFHQAIPMALDNNSSPEEAQCTDRVPGYTYEASLGLDSWRLGVALYKLWCRESWDPSTDSQKWEQELERRRRYIQARTTDPFNSVQRYTRHRLVLKHCRKDTPSFILRLIQQFLEPNAEARLTALDAVRGSSLFMYMKRRITTAQAILENIKQNRRREEL